MLANLASLVSEIVQSRPAGLKHFEIVQEVLRRGYVHDNDTDKSLSEVVYEALKNLVSLGKVRQIQNDRLERRYKTIMAATDQFDDCHDLETKRA